MSNEFINNRDLILLAEEISKEYSAISNKFSEFQKNNGLSCIESCGKCCFKPDIYCSPIELLPMALKLLKTGKAQEFYDLSLSRLNEKCVFLNVTNENKFEARCSEYADRPLICRTFGVSARHGKKDKKIEYSVCKLIKEDKPLQFQSLLLKTESEEEGIPFIDSSKNQLMAIDPRFLEKEFPMNQALSIILEKVLLYSQYSLED